MKFAEIDTVKSLHHQELGTSGGGSGLETLKTLSERRKKRHDVAISVWENERKELYDEMEEKVGGFILKPHFPRQLYPLCRFLRAVLPFVSDWVSWTARSPLP